MSLNVNEELYRSVRLVLGDADREFVKSVTAALFPIGLRDLSICTDGQQLKSAVAANVDVVVCDVNLPDVDFMAFSQDVRHERLAGNPFIVLIATSKPTDEGTIAHILQSGVDDLIIKPADASTLVRRIGAFARGRKPFVITPGYIGPTRRAARRDDGTDDDAILEVPNTVRAKVAHRLGPDQIERQIQLGRASLAGNAASTSVRVLVRLTKKVAAMQNDLALVEQSRRLLRLLANKANEVVMQYRSSPNGRFIVPIAEQIARLSFRAETAPVRPPEIEVGLLNQLSDAAQIAAIPPKETDAVPVIVSIVDSYLNKK